MSKKTIVSIALLFISPLIVYFVWPTDESRIKKLFKEGAKAVEEEKVDDVMSKVSFNYTDEHGFSYLALKEVAQRMFGQFSHIRVEYRITRIDIKGEKAVAELDIRVIASRGQETGYVAGDASAPEPIKFFLEKERLKWLVTKTEGIPVGL